MGGKVLLSVTTYAALRQCIDHFHGLPWFHAPTCTVPSVTATQVQTAKSSKSHAEKEKQQPQTAFIKVVCGCSCFCASLVVCRCTCFCSRFNGVESQDEH